MFVFWTTGLCGIEFFLSLELPAHLLHVQLSKCKKLSFGSAERRGLKVAQELFLR